MKGRFGLILVLGLWTGLLVGCQSQSAADKWLADSLGPHEKATLLVDQGIDRYNKMVEADTLDQIPQVKEVFLLAKKTWPLEPRVDEWLKKVDGFKDKRQSEVQVKAKSLAAKATLTDKEKYSLVLLVHQLQGLAPPDLDLTKLNAQVAPVRAEVLKKSAQGLVSAQAALRSAPNDVALLKDFGALHTAVETLRLIDPQNSDADAGAKTLAEVLNTKTKAALDQAQGAYRAKDYPGAVRPLTLADQAASEAGAPASAEVGALRYRVNFDWAKDLFAAKKYGEAGARAADALGALNTDEARDLRDKIAAVALFRDYDAEYDSIDRQIDSLVKSGDLKTAWAQVTAAGPQLKKDDLKTRLLARRKQILDAVHALYDTAVASYNDEDYQEAKAGLETVVAVDPTWQLAKAYLDKARSKIQALGTGQ